MKKQEFLSSVMSKDKVNSNKKNFKLFFYAFTFILLVILFLMATYFFIISKKNKKTDKQIIAELQIIDSEINAYYELNGKLPKKLLDLKQYTNLPLEAKDLSDFFYYPKDVTSYNLCSNFKTSNIEKEKNPSINLNSGEHAVDISVDENNWEHEAGKYCFPRKIPDAVMKKFVHSAYSSIVSMMMVSLIKSIKSECVSGEEIKSGFGHDEICISKYDSMLWPIVPICGTDPENSNWIVKNGKNFDWDFVLNCKDFTGCNGPNNAICNKDGCKFSNTCK